MFLLAFGLRSLPSVVFPSTFNPSHYYRFEPHESSLKCRKKKITRARVHFTEFQDCVQGRDQFDVFACQSVIILCDIKFLYHLVIRIPVYDCRADQRHGAARDEKQE